MRNTGRRGRRVLAAFAIVVLASAFAALVPAPVLARGGTVEAMIAAAQREFDAGNFARAGGLFLAIWRQGPSSDRTQLAALYNAARAYQLAEELDQAEALFRELAAYPAGAVRRGGLGNDVLEPGQLSAGLEFAFGAEMGAGPKVRVGLPLDIQVSVWAGWLGSAVLGGDVSRVVLGAGGSTSLGVGVGFWTWLDGTYAQTTGSSGNPRCLPRTQCPRTG